MKKILFLLIGIGYVLCVQAQTIYKPGEIAKGDSVAYYCTGDEYYLRISNVDNVDSSSVMYYKDGRMAERYEPEGYPLFKHEDLVKVFCEELTPEELNRVKGMYVYHLRIMVVCDSDGNAKEIVFTFVKDDPVLAKFTPDRFYHLEQKLKKLLKAHLSQEDKAIKNIKYITSVGYADIK